MTTIASTHDRFFPVPQFIERWPIGRTMVYQLIKFPEFPKALVLLRDCHGQPRSMGYREADIVGSSDSDGGGSSSDNDRSQDSPVGLAGVKQDADAVVGEVAKAVAIQMLASKDRYPQSATGVVVNGEGFGGNPLEIGCGLVSPGRP